jgi:hypothetical protein
MLGHVKTSDTARAPRQISKRRGRHVLDQTAASANDVRMLAPLFLVAAPCSSEVKLAHQLGVAQHAQRAINSAQADTGKLAPSTAMNFLRARMPFEISYRLQHHLALAREPEPSPHQIFGVGLRFSIRNHS